MIKFIFFDLGGVVIRDFSGREDKWSELKREIGIEKEKEEEYRLFLGQERDRSVYR